MSAADNLIAETEGAEKLRLQNLIKALKSELKESNEALLDAKRRVRFIAELNNAKAIKPIVEKSKKRGKREATAFSPWSDWHVEEVVLPEKVNGRNEYNLKIADRRIDRLVEGFLWHLKMYRNEYEIRTAIIGLLGDLMTGYIHEELEETNEMSPPRVLLWLLARVERALRAIMEFGELDELIVPCCHGNHGRTTKKKRIKTGADNSYEWLMYNVLADKLKDDSRIKFQIAEGAHVYYNVYGDTHRVQHGDSIKGGSGIGGIMIPINRKIAQWAKTRRVDHDAMGHFHSYHDLPHLTVNSSLIGYSEFAIEIGAPFEPPSQAFCLFDSRRGKRHSTRIYVDREPKRAV